MAAYKWGWNPKYTEIYLITSPGMIQANREAMAWICLFDAWNEFLKIFSQMVVNNDEKIMGRSLKIIRKKKKIQDGRGIGDSFPRKPSWGDLVLLILEVLFFFLHP